MIISTPIHDSALGNVRAGFGPVFLETTTDREFLVVLKPVAKVGGVGFVLWSTFKLLSRVSGKRSRGR